MAATTPIATLAAMVSSAITCSKLALILDLLDQALELGQIFLGELLLFAEMRDERCDAAAKQAIEQALAFARQPFFALHYRRVQVAAAIAFGADRALVKESVEQRFD